jgi:hypothetical protein
MSFDHPTKAHFQGPDGLKPATGAHTLGFSVEVRSGPVSDLCTQVAGSPDGARERILTWLAEGAREVTWALCSVPRERWVADPPGQHGEWPALRHARHLALRESHVTLPRVRHALGDIAVDELPSTAEIESADAAWDPRVAIESAEEIVRELGSRRFEVLQRVEGACDEAWDRLDWLLLTARQHELEHLAAMWKVALYWDCPHPNPRPVGEGADVTPCRQASGVTLR